MERLEAAIKKARGQQTGVETLPRPRDVTTARVATQSAVSNDAQAAWDALPALHLDAKQLKRNRVMTLEPTPQATAFDVLRTRTLRHMQEHGWRRLAITSPTASCGKSTIAINMALSMARQHKSHTISIEMDMRRPSQERLLGIAKKADRSIDPAVARLLRGEAAFEDVAKRVGHNLALVTSEYELRNASDILLDVHVGEKLDAVEARYQPDVMLFDMPPALLTDDTLAFMQHVDGVLLVAASEMTTIAEIDRCERELAKHTNVMGVVLNKCRLASAEYGGYGYKYGYGYGY